MPHETFLRLRLSGRDTRSETGQIDSTRLFELFNDAATELCIRQVGDEGILRAYSHAEFFSPLSVGDFIEVIGRLVDVGPKTCTIELVAHKVIRAARTLAAPLAGEVLAEPRLVARATGVWLVPPRARTTATIEAGDGDTVDAAEATGEAEAPAAEPMSWGGHRPQDRPSPKQRPGPDVRLRGPAPEIGREGSARRDADERPRPREERRPLRASQDRDDRPRSRTEGDWEPERRRPRDDDQGYGDRPRSSERPYGDRPRSSERSTTDRPRSGERPYGDRPRTSERPYGERARSTDRPGSDRPRSPRPTGGTRRK